ncbi:MAG: hypothetical protein IOC90_12350 [Methylocystis sp.]|nr:hypothetical protein [Methylocystis sp.]MCA3583319.1 hypothetical protein [Methylocystis sp.]MCA3588806.1 hypothetical protein [Methylocystis sp.]MCA3591838.1 hypothetical protein [Methylocystis sp.]
MLSFFQALSERMATAFSDAAKMVPAARGDGPAVSARGNLRRLHLDRAFRAAAADTGYPIVTGTTTPPSWNYPIIRLGAFSLTLGIVQRATSYGPRRLRSRGNYAYDHVVRNGPANPQGSLLASAHDVVEVIPDGALGAFVVAESSVHVPDSPLYLGFMVPAPNLRQSYFMCSLERLVGLLQERVAAERRPARKKVERKLPKLKKLPKHPPGK